MAPWSPLLILLAYDMVKPNINMRYLDNIGLVDIVGDRRHAELPVIDGLAAICP